MEGQLIGQFIVTFIMGTVAGMTILLAAGRQSKKISAKICKFIKADCCSDNDCSDGKC